jgi:23S rRNA (cytosine1962-C5)-methyltransferase
MQHLPPQQVSERQPRKTIVRPLPVPSSRRIAMRVTPEAERALQRHHPWVFESAIERQNRDGRSGDLAVIFDRKRRFLAAGLYDPNSSIRVRVLQHQTPAVIDERFFGAKLALAAELRSDFLEGPSSQNTTGHRLVHGENDGLPGLVIDRYGSTVVFKLYSSAWLPYLGHLLIQLESICAIERAVLRFGRGMSHDPSELFGLNDGDILLGSRLDGPLLFKENGLCFECDPVRGHKTGFYLDQRENRARLEKLAEGKTVLNVFAYTGASAVYAARGGARQITSIDVSEPALQAAGRNFHRNRHFSTVSRASHRTVVSDAFEELERMRRAGLRFDVVVIDPPSFARKQSHIKRALAAYRRLTRLSLGVLQPGGTLVQASCSSRVAPSEFYAALHQAAVQAGRSLREIERTGHPLDHPVAFEEGAYLKCLFAVVA